MGPYSLAPAIIITLAVLHLDNILHVPRFTRLLLVIAVHDSHIYYVSSRPLVNRRDGKYSSLVARKALD
jgi:hypothetical protein